VRSRCLGWLPLVLLWLNACGTSDIDQPEPGQGEAGSDGAEGGSGGSASECQGPSPAGLEALPLLDFSDYHRGPEIAAYLAEVASALPGWVTHRVFGNSAGGRSLDVLTVDLTCAESSLAVFLNGAHHGDEPVSAEVVLGVLDTLLRSREPEVLDALSRYRFLFMPVVNPDGLAAGTRSDRNGLDLNRDYPYPGRTDGAFTTPETRAVEELSTTEQVTGALAFHSGMLSVLWPYCHTTAPTPDDQSFFGLASRVATGLGTSAALQSAHDYVSYGEYIDYAYTAHGTLALTVEVAAEKSPEPAELASIVRAGWVATRHFLAGLAALEAGQLPRSEARTLSSAVRSPRDRTGRLE